MRFKKNDDTYFELDIHSYTPEININYNLVQMSGGNFISVDRGVSTDRYASTIDFYTNKEYIKDLVSELTILRDNGKEVIFDQFSEHIFGDNVDHSPAISCVIGDFGEEKVEDLNAKKISITFIPTNLTFTGDETLPSLTCVDYKWQGFADWNTHVNETYNRSNYFVDHKADSYVFEGTYLLTLEENVSLLSYWKTQRGQKFTINDGDFGVTNMFGSYLNDATYDVIIKDINYVRVSPTLRNTTITLLKV